MSKIQSWSGLEYMKILPDIVPDEILFFVDQKRKPQNIKMKRFKSSLKFLSRRRVKMKIMRALYEAQNDVSDYWYPKQAICFIISSVKW